MNPYITVRIILLIACVGPVSLGQETSSLDQEALAEIAKGIEEAETLTWTVQVYRGSSGNDGQPPWTTLGRSELSFQAPNLYRDTRYDKQGNVGSVEIINTETNKTLRVDYEAKKASWLNQPTNVYGPEDPITNLAHLVKNAPLPAIGTRDVDGVTVNVLRYAKGRSMDLWINAKTSRLVGMSIPGADVFDPLSADATDGPKMGQLRKNIVYGESLDSDLFEMKPPEGFAVTQTPTRISETDLVEWLAAAARFNNGVFPETERGFDLASLGKVRRVKKADRTDAQNKLIELFNKHMMNRNMPVTHSFMSEHGVDGSFKYVGKGVKLDEADKIVCWYQAKGSETYRAVMADLTVKDVAAEDLPAANR